MYKNAVLLSTFLLFCFSLSAQNTPGGKDSIFLNNIEKRNNKKGNTEVVCIMRNSYSTKGIVLYYNKEILVSGYMVYFSRKQTSSLSTESLDEIRIFAADLSCLNTIDNIQCRDIDHSTNFLFLKKQNQIIKERKLVNSTCFNNLNDKDACTRFIKRISQLVTSK